MLTEDKNKQKCGQIELSNEMEHCNEPWLMSSDTEELLFEKEVLNKVQGKRIFTIALTGGPCAGKSSCLADIEETFTQKGYVVFIVPETATELIVSGYCPTMACTTNYEFQKFLLKKQLLKEQLYMEIAQNITADKVIIIFDRGCIDGKAYIDHKEFCSILAALGTNETERSDFYDAAIHLVTAADGAEEAYSLSNNQARTETPEEARALDRKCIAAWTGHRHLRIIDNSTDFKTKKRRVIQEICRVIGEPIPIEIERKFLIKFPDIDVLKNIISCQEIDIIQAYLMKDDNTPERRIRQRGMNNQFSYYYTEKRDISSTQRAEIEKRISIEEYTKLLTEIDSNMRPIKKTRFCFAFKGQYFELDVFPFSDEKAILEIELTEENQNVYIPDFLDVIGDVTDNPKYRNYNLAKNRIL